VPKCEINKRIENTEAVLLLFAAAVGCRSAPDTIITLALYLSQ